MYFFLGLLHRRTAPPDEDHLGLTQEEGTEAGAICVCVALAGPVGVVLTDLVLEENLLVLGLAGRRANPGMSGLPNPLEIL